MSGSSTIEWTDSTWSQVVGCTRVSAGCDNCYAVRQTRRLEAMGQEKYAGLVNSGKTHFNGTARLHAPSLDWPLRWRGSKAAKAEGRPSRVFVNPMADLFHERLSDEDIAAVFGVMAACPQHTFQVLTKRPERMREWFAKMEARPVMVPDAEVSGCILAMLRTWSLGTHPVSIMQAGRNVGPGHAPPWPLPNVWLGVSVEDQATADARIPLLLQTPAAIRFVSYEPALGPVDFRSVPVPQLGASFWNPLLPPPSDAGGAWAKLGKIDWLIVGGESGPSARPFDLAWARSAVEQCKAAGVPVFVKQLGAKPYAIGTHTRDGLRSIRHRKGGDPSEWPEDLRVREFPA